MANIGEITQAAYYRGDANLAGGNSGVFKADLSALQRLADFSYYRNKDLYDQQRKERQESIGTLSNALSVDWSTLTPKHYQEVKGVYDRFVSFVKENPDAIRFESGEKFQEYLKMKNELENAAKAGATRAVEYKAGVAEINKLAEDEGMKNMLRSQLDSQLANSSIFTPIEGVAQYQAKPLNMSAIRARGQFVTIGGDDNLTTKYDVYDFNGNERQAAAMVFALQSNRLGPAAANLKQQAETFNEIIKENVDANGNLNQGIMSDPTIGPIMKLIDSYNASVTKTKSVLPGSKRRVSELIGGEPKPINITDGVSDIELMQLVLYANAGPDAVETSVVHTGEASQNRRNSASIASSERIAKMNNESRATKGTGAAIPQGQTPNQAWQSLLQNYNEATGQAQAVKMKNMDIYMQNIILSIFPNGETLKPEQVTVYKQGEQLVFSTTRKNQTVILGTVSENTFNKAYADYQAKINTGGENPSGLNPRAANDPWAEYQID